MAIVIIILILAMFLFFALYKPGNPKIGTLSTDRYDVFKKISIGQSGAATDNKIPETYSKIKPEDTEQKKPPAGYSATTSATHQENQSKKMTTVKKTILRPPNRRAGSTRNDLQALQAQFQKYRDRHSKDRQEQTFSATDAQPEFADVIPTANVANLPLQTSSENDNKGMVIPIIPELQKTFAKSPEETGGLNPPPGQTQEFHEMAHTVLPRDTDRFDGQFYKRPVEESTKLVELEEKIAKINNVLSETRRLRISPQILTTTPGESLSVGETTQKLHQIESLCSEIDKIIGVLQRRSEPEERADVQLAATTKDLGIGPHYSKDFKDKVNKAMSQGHPVKLQDVDKILEELQLPQPEDLLQKEITPNFSELPDSLEMGKPNLSSPSESIEKWKKMLGFQ